MTRLLFILVLLSLTACDRDYLSTSHFAVSERQVELAGAGSHMTVTEVTQQLVDRLSLAEQTYAAHPEWRDDVESEVEAARLVAWERRLLQEVSAKASTPAALDEAYGLYGSELTAEELHLSQIYVPYRLDVPGDLERAEQRIRKADVLLTQGVDFASVVSQTSLDPYSVGKGGDLGWVKRESLPDALAAALAGRKVGERTGIVRDRGNFRILLLREERIQTRTRQEAESWLQGRVRQKLMAERLEQGRDDVDLSAKARKVLTPP